MILSPGRSGTSMVAGLFEKQGYFFGTRSYRPSTRFNRKGFFEDPDINRLNEKLLEAAGVPSPQGARGPRIGQRWLQAVEDLSLVTPSADQGSEISSLIARHEPFCYKEPRFCYTLHAWRPYLDVNRTVFVCIARSPVETARSIERFCRGMWEMELPTEQGLKVWASMFRHVVYDHSTTGQWLFLEFESLIRDRSYREQSLDAIGDFTGAKVDEESICPDLRTQWETPGDLAALGRTNPELHRQITNLSDELRRLCLQR